MQVLTAEEREQFKVAADKCLEIVAAGTPDDELFEDDNIETFIELLASLLEKYDDLSGLRYREKTFVPEYSHDEDGDYISGVRWFDDDKFEVIE
ncbi:MAG: hypothetical protein AB8G99_13495 [Planctomycetaceae bacterium]